MATLPVQFGFELKRGHYQQCSEKLYSAAINKMNEVARQGNMIIESQQILTSLSCFLSKYSNDPAMFDSQWDAANM